MSQPVTQKARGLVALQSTGHSVPSFYVITGEDQIQEGWERLSYFGKPVFARPAPRWPIPGFVESRVVADLEDLRQHWNAMRALSTDAEMILSTLIPAEFNAVWTSGLCAVGPGHDGATAARDSVSFPCRRVDLADLTEWRGTLQKSGVLDNPEEANRHAHMEAVFSDKGGSYAHRYQMLWTQIRAGGEVRHGGNFVPRRITVKEVIYGAECDTGSLSGMIDFDKRVKERRNSDSVVIYHPAGNGGDHVSLQAWSNGVALIIDGEEPKIGDVIEEIKTTPPDVLGVLRYFLAGLQLDIRPKVYKSGMIYSEEIKAGTVSTWDALRLMLVLLHGFSPHGRDARWLGLAAAIMLRLGTAASLGEARHATRKGRGIERTQIYKDAFQAPYSEIRSALTRTCDLFADPRRWAGGYGGTPWLCCATSIVALDSACLKLIKNPCLETLQDVVGVLNLSVNLAHNNGWWLNKYDSSESVADDAAHGNPELVVSVAPTAWRINKFIESLDKETLLGEMSSLSKARTLRAMKRHYPTLELEMARQAGRQAAATCNSEAILAQHTNLAHLTGHNIVANCDPSKAQAYIIKEDGKEFLKIQIPTKNGLNYYSWVTCSNQLADDMGDFKVHYMNAEGKTTTYIKMSGPLGFATIPTTIIDHMSKLPSLPSFAAGGSKTYKNIGKYSGFYGAFNDETDKLEKLYLFVGGSNPNWSFMVPINLDNAFKAVETDKTVEADYPDPDDDSDYHYDDYDTDEY